MLGVFVYQPLGRGVLPCEGRICGFLSLNVDSHIKLIPSAI